MGHDKKPYRVRDLLAQELSKNLLLFSESSQKVGQETIRKYFMTFAIFMYKSVLVT